MEPLENNEEKNLGGRPKNVTPQQIAERAKKVRSGLMLGKGRSQICAEEGLTIPQYNTAMRWVSRRWDNNATAFAEFLAGEQNRLEALQERLNAVLADPALFEAQKAVIALKIHRLCHDIQFNVREMGLRLGILDREAIKIQELPKVTVGFGDEMTAPWFAKKPKGPALKNTAEQVN